MESRIDKEIQKLQIQIGCLIKLSRLKKGLSQFELALMIGANSTLIGRIERAAVISGWDKVYIIAESLNIRFSELFSLKTKKELLNIVSESQDLEKKLTSEKLQYYNSLKKEISKLFQD